MVAVVADELVDLGFPDGCACLRALGGGFLGPLSGVGFAGDAVPIDVHEWWVNTFDRDAEERVIHILCVWEIILWKREDRCAGLSAEKK